MSLVEVEEPAVWNSFGLSFPNGDRAPKVARDMVAHLLVLTGHPFAAESARLLVSEVVTNVYQHTTTLVVHIDVTVRSDHVVVSVWDNKPEDRPSVLRACAEQEGGRGLRLVAAVATRWGVTDPEARRKRVWFSLAEDGGRGPCQVIGDAESTGRPATSARASR